MAEEDTIAKEAYEFAAGAGGAIASATEVAGPVGLAVGAAAAVGVGAGMALEYVTDGAISDTLSDGLLGLVGDEESLAAANDFDDGNYISGVGHMLSGAGSTIADGAGEAADWVADEASDAVDWVSDEASDVYDTVSDAAGDAYDTVSDAASDVVDFLNPFD
jgi:hypothetical protein